MPDALNSRPEFATLQRLVADSGLPVSVEAADDGVMLRYEVPPDSFQFRHSFAQLDFVKRAKQADQSLLKACHNKQNTIRRVLDVTAGWGMDSFMLALHGREVTMLEQQPVVQAIVAFSLLRARELAHTAQSAQRIETRCVNAAIYLAELEPNRFDCIYLDPMFPEHKSSAKPAKEMQLLQRLTQNVDIEACFELALQKTANRVVLKRPAKAKPFNSLIPDIVYREKTIRFEVYLAR